MRKVVTCLLIVSSLLEAKGQNVGVGTTTPVEKLHVEGNIKADTVKPAAINFSPNAGAGKILTSDANGNAAWQSMTTNTTGSTGFGAWGDCATNANIGGHNPVSHPNALSGDQFGKSVSISGNYAIVGAHNDDVEGNSNQGSASIFRFNGEQWEFMQLLTDPGGAASDLFGISVALSGDYAVVGASFADIGVNTDQGAACVFHFDGTNWVFVERLTDPAGAADDNFGFSVAISSSFIIAGAYGGDVSFTDQGTASIFQFDGSNWIFFQQLTHPVAAADDLFGRSVSISGNTLIVGAYFDDVATMNQGSALIFQFDGSAWVYTQLLTDPSGAANDNFGNSVSISGDHLIVGIQSDDATVTNQGSVLMFHYNGTGWEPGEQLFDQSPATGEQFGNHVCISGNYAIVGESGDQMSRGSATIFQRVGLGWQRLQYITDPAIRLNDAFGSSTGIDGTSRRFIIGAQGYRLNSGKAVFGRIN
jgi:hypothetical protein